MPTYTVFFSPPCRQGRGRGGASFVSPRRWSATYCCVQSCAISPNPDRTAVTALQALLQAVHRSLCSRDRGLWVVDASGLVKADFFGKSDPYAKVHVYVRSHPTDHCAFGNQSCGKSACNEEY